MQLTFSSFITEATYDLVNVCEGLICAPGSHWAQLSGRPSQSDLHYSSVGNVLTVELITDGTSEFSGFNATYTTSTTTTTTTTTAVTTSTATTTLQPIATSEPLSSETPTTQPPPAIILTSEPPSCENPSTQTSTTIVTQQITNADKEMASRVPLLINCVVISLCWALNFPVFTQ